MWHAFHAILRKAIPNPWLFLKNHLFSSSTFWFIIFWWFLILHLKIGYVWNLFWFKAWRKDPDTFFFLTASQVCPNYWLTNTSYCHWFETLPLLIQNMHMGSVFLSTLIPWLLCLSLLEFMQLYVLMLYYLVFLCPFSFLVSS